MRGRRRFAAIASGFAVTTCAVAATVAVLASQASAVTLHVGSFAGYETYKTGNVTATTTFTVPSVTCGAAPSGIAPGLEAVAAANPNATHYLYAALLEMTCSNGSLSVKEAMFASGLETDYTHAVAAKDKITATVTTTTGGTTITMKDTTAPDTFTLTDSGSESYQFLQDFGASATTANGQDVPVPPKFNPIAFSATTVGTKSLSAISPQAEFQYGSSSLCLVYAIPTKIVNNKNFAVEIPPINITSYSPTQELAGQVVTIDGYGFNSRTLVTFSGGKASTKTTVVSPTELRATIPMAALPGPLTVTNTSAPIGTMTDLCSFNPLPVITKLSLTSGPTGTIINIDGGAFSSTTSVTIGNQPITTYAVTNPSAPTVIKATIPNGATTGQITVTTLFGSATSASPFTVTLSITGFSPTSGPAGTSVTINGVGFNKSSKVSFGKLKATTTFVSSTELKAIVPAGFAGGEFSVTNSSPPLGTVFSPGPFQVM